jgi:hypothetical protein
MTGHHMWLWLNPLSLLKLSPSNIKNSEAFIQKLNTIHLQESDILVSFYMVSLFTMVPLEDTVAAATMLP